MPKITCPYTTYKQDTIICKLTSDICGHQKYCRIDNRFKLSDSAYNCTLLKKSKEVNNNENKRN
jgi:hypothetical protein